MIDSKNTKRLGNIRALLHLLLVALGIQWLAASFVEYLNLSGHLDRMLRNPAGAQSVVSSMRDLLESSCFVLTGSLVIVVSLIVIGRRIRRDLDAGKFFNPK